MLTRITDRAKATDSLFSLFSVSHTVMCLFMCRDKWSDREKALSHILHWNGLSPVCFLMCLVSSSDLANLQLQPFQLHT